MVAQLGFLLVLVELVGALVINPASPCARQCQQPRHAPLALQIRESRIAPITEISPGARYRQMKEAGVKFYSGRKANAVSDLRSQLKNVGKRKVRFCSSSVP